MLVHREAWKKIFLRHLKNGATIGVAATLANVGLDRIIQAKNLDTEFASDIIAVSQSKKKQMRG